MSVFSAVKELSKTVEADIGPVDILVNNAAVLPLVSLREGTECDLDRIIDVNFKSNVWVSYLVSVKLWHNVIAITNFIDKAFYNCIDD